MFVYKLTCETGKVYYGATKNTVEYRKSKGHHHCTCKDFINPKIEIVEKVDNIENLFIREKWYIQNNDCVNSNGKIVDKNEYYKNYQKKWRAENPEKNKAKNAKSLIAIKCNLCDALTSKKHIKRHQKSNKCINART